MFLEKNRDRIEKDFEDFFQGTARKSGRDKEENGSTKS